MKGGAHDDDLGECADGSGGSGGVYGVFSGGA